MPRCIYCGNRAGSIEHIYPSWMVEALSRDPRGLQLPVETTIWRDGTVLRKMLGKVKPRKTVEVTTKVCIGCNTGWMNRIASRARSAVESMMGGNPTDLPRDAQARIAAFMTMTAITMFAAHHRQFIKPAWTRALRQTETALPDWYVWATHYDGSQPLLVRMHDITGVSADGVTVVDHGVVVTLGVGYLALQVLHGDGLRPEDHPMAPLLRVGPPSDATVYWPPESPPLTDESVEAFADRFLSVDARRERHDDAL